MSINTRRSADCPICAQRDNDPPGKTAYVALLPYATGEGEALHIVEPHKYAVCRDCYLIQFRGVYPDEPFPELEVMPTFGKKQLEKPVGVEDLGGISQPPDEDDGAENTAVTEDDVEDVSAVVGDVS